MEIDEEEEMFAELDDNDHTYLQNLTIDDKIGSGNFVSSTKKIFSIFKTQILSFLGCCLSW